MSYKQKTSFDSGKHYQTKNQRGFMHPLAEMSKQFVAFAASTTKPVIDMGCAYGNTVIAALEAGTETVIACDMAEEHLAAIKEQVANTPLESHLITANGVFPNDFDFGSESVSAIHLSHILEYLKGNEIERGLEKCYHWLDSRGRLFIITYSIHILELDNPNFHQEYAYRLNHGDKWPGYLENYNAYCTPDETIDNSPFPKALHMFEVEPLVNALTELGFIIEFADYLDGRTNGAITETWHDGREYVGIIAHKS